MSSQGNDDGPRPIVVIGVVVITLALIAATTLLSMTGKSVGDLMAVLAVAGGFVGAIFGAKVHSTVQASNNLANGNLSAMRDAFINLAQQVASQPAAPPPVVIVKPLDPPPDQAEAA